MLWRCARSATRSSRSSRTTTRTRAAIAMAGAQRRVVTLRPARLLRSTSTALAAAIDPRTRLLLLNSPHNPTGKVFARDELEVIARLCVEHDLIAVTDEVYEHLVLDGDHVPLATLPGHARAHDHDLVGRQDVLLHRLEGRLGVRARRRSSPRSAPPSSSSPTSTRRRSSTRSRSASTCPTRTSPSSPPISASRRDLLSRRAWPTPASTVLPPGRHLLRHHRHPRRSARPTASRSADRSPSGAAWSPSPTSCSTTTARPACRSCASPSASASRSSRRRSAA